MSKEYTPFVKLAERAAQMYHAYNLIGEEKLNKDGCAERRAYGIISNAFDFADTKADIVQHLRKEIADLKAEIQKIPTEDLMKNEWSEDAAVIQLLRKYIRFNCPTHLWKNFPEFDEPTT